MQGDVTINGADAYTTYGLNLEDGALSALMTPAPTKEFIETKSRLSSGKKVIVNSPKLDSRELTLPFHIVGSTKEEFLSNYSLFCSNVLANGSFTLETKYQQGVVYNLIYLSCTQFRQYQQSMGIFSLKVLEPDPTDRQGTSGGGGTIDPSITYNLTFVCSPENGGSCGCGQQNPIASGTILEVRAVANEGYTFVQWSDGNTNANRAVTMNSDITLTAIFEEN